MGTRDHGTASPRPPSQAEPMPAGRGACLPLVIVALAAVAVYANTLANGLHVDDQYQIVTNPWVRSFSNLPAVFSSGVWDFDGRVSSYYRPMMYVWYMLVYAVAATSAWAYHVLNVVLHTGASILVFLVARELLGPPVRSRAWWLDPAWFAGMLFAVHPVHTEPVAWAAGIVDLSYACFSLLAFYLVVVGRGRAAYVAAALAAYAVALLSKEPAITVPAVLAVFWWVGDRRDIGIRGVARRLTPWLALSVGYLAVRRLALGGLVPQTAPIDLAPWEYVLTATALLGRFLRASVFPTELNFWHVFSPVRDLWSIDALMAALTVGTWVLLFSLALRRRLVVPATALVLALLPLTPALLLRSLNQGLENAFAERYVYLPSAGVALLAGWAVWALLARARARQAMIAMICLASLALVGAAVTTRRNRVWVSSLTLWSDAVAKSPQSGMANVSYGFALLSAGQTELGQRYVQKGIAISPQIVQQRMTRAVSYAQSGRSTEAILAFHNVLVMDPGSSAAHFNLGVLYEERGQAGMAIREYQAAIAINPGAADAHNNLGILLITSGKTDESIRHFEEAVRLRPADAAYRANLERARPR